MSNRLRLVSFVALAAIVAGGFAYYQQRQSADKAASAKGTQLRPVPVTLATVESGSVPVKLSLVGRTEAYSTVTMRARIDGMVTESLYTPGMHVRKGQVMVRLDARAIQAQVAQGEANLARDRAQFDKARSDLARYNDLLAKGYISPAQLETYRATVDTLEATVKADVAALDLLRVQLTYTTIEAPMDGVAGAVLVYPGGGVKANDTALVVINQLRPLNVTFAVPETQLVDVNRERLAERLRVEARVPGSAAPVIGQLAFVDNTVDPTTGTIQMKARFENADQKLSAGQFVNVSITVRTIENALVIPGEALQSGPDGNFVYVAKPDRTVEVRKVQTRQADERRLIVLAGLAAGEKVVTDGQVRLTPGSRYEARDAGKPPAAGGLPDGKAPDTGAAPTGKTPDAGAAPAGKAPDAGGFPAAGKAS
jgi:membrane fusion protein, multidrug efflux system